MRLCPGCMQHCLAMQQAASSTTGPGSCMYTASTHLPLTLRVVVLAGGHLPAAMLLAPLRLMPFWKP